jgi:hypothetical protein
MEWFYAVADKGLQEVRTDQPSSQQLLDDVTMGCILWRSFRATPYPHLGSETGRLTMNTGSDASATVLK